MTRGTIRTLLRRQLGEVVAQNWDDPTLNDLANVAYHITQKEIMKLDPEAFLEWVRRDIEADKEDYPRPEGSWWPNQVRLKNTSTGLYTRLKFKPFDEAETWTTSNLTGNVWSRRGIYVFIFPVPTVAVTAGLELIHVPTLTLAVDADVPKVPLGLHMALVYLAKIVALGETYQNYDKDVAMVEKILWDLGSYYSVTGGESLTFQPDIIKAIGYAG